MRRFVYLLLSVGALSPLFGSGGHFSSTAHQRHEAIKKYLTEDRSIFEEEPWWKWPLLTGTWGGLRSDLAERGITITSEYWLTSLGNPTGGVRRGNKYVGSWALDLLADLEQVFGFCGWEFYVSAAWRTGRSLSQTDIENDFHVSEIFGGMTGKLDCLYLRKNFADGRSFAKIGRINVGNNFITSPLYDFYVNTIINNNPGSIFFNVPFSTHPRSTWGAMIDAYLACNLELKLGVFNANSRIWENRFHGLNFTFESTRGWLLIGEWTWIRYPGGLPGHYTIGSFWATGKFPLFRGGEGRGSGSLYIMWDQMIYQRCGERGIYPLASVVFAPKDRAVFPFFFLAGAVWKGPLDCRPKDQAMFGVYYGKYSSERIFEGQHQSYEMVVELNYLVQMTPWCFWQPALQFVFNPRGLGRIPNAVVIGLQAGFVL